MKACSHRLLPSTPVLLRFMFLKEGGASKDCSILAAAPAREAAFPTQSRDTGHSLVSLFCLQLHNHAIFFPL